MSDRPDLVEFAEAFLFGAVVPPGLLSAMPSVQAAVPALEPVLAVGWFAAVALGTAALGAVRAVSTDALVGGAAFGTVAGFSAFAVLVGWSFVAFAVVLVAIVAVVLGAWVAYERERRRGDVAEPTYGTWRGVLALLLAAPIVLLAVLVLV